MKAKFMATADLKNIMKRTVSVEKYLDKMTQSFKDKFSERKQTYQLNEEAVQRLKKPRERCSNCGFLS